MYCRLEPCIRWPDKETVCKTLPTAFQKPYSKVQCIIDCTEVFIEQPTSMQARAQTYSNYKSITPSSFSLESPPQESFAFYQNAGVEEYRTKS